MILYYNGKKQEAMYDVTEFGRDGSRYFIMDSK